MYFLISVCLIVLSNILFSGELDSLNKYKYITNNEFLINNEKMDLRILNGRFEFDGYMIFEFSFDSNKFDSTYYNGKYSWVNSINDIQNPFKHYEYVFPLHYSNYVFGNNNPIYDSLKSVFFEDFSEKYSLLLNKIDSQERKDKYFTWSHLKTNIFDDPKINLYIKEMEPDIGYYVFKCSFECILVEFTGYSFSDKLNYRIITSLIPVSKILKWELVSKNEMAFYGYKKVNWMPQGLYNKIN